MAGNAKSGASLRETMIKKYGSEEAWKQAMRNFGRKGGANGHTGGFYINRELARIAGSKGGKASKGGGRKKQNVSQDQ
jgi:general stress protein YciG